MTESQRLIKKYPNRRLYDTRTSAYITLADIKELVLQHENFLVVDAKTGDDLTRAILLQIIFPNLRSSLLSGAFLTLATVVGEFTIASFLVGINAFGPYMSLVGQNKTYESSALAIISFALTWLFMGLIQFFGRGQPGQRPLVGAR